jgi:hypothetical protein
MLQITGQVINIFTVPGGKDKEGKEYDASNKVQLMGEVMLPSGEMKYDLMDLKVDDLPSWEVFKGRTVSVEVGAFAPSKGNIIFTVKKGAKPKEIKA